VGDVDEGAPPVTGGGNALDRATLFADPSLRGVAICKVYSDRMDAWLSGLFDRARSGADPSERMALLAVGGYGRAELAPESDIDVLLLHDGVRRVAEVAEAIWYPVWDEGLKLGHAVRTPKEALALAADDLDTATSLVTVRHLAGDEELAADLADRAMALWRKRSRRWLAEISARVRTRQASAGEVAFLLEPDLKEGRGGLRDVHAIRWAEMAQAVMLEGDDAALAANHDVLMSARVELHRLARRPGDRLLLEEQDGVAAALDYSDADALMHAVSTAARAIAWTSDDLWERVDSSLTGPRGWRVSRDRVLEPDVVLREGRVCISASADPSSDQLLLLRVAAVAAEQGVRIERSSLDRLAASAPLVEAPWTEEARALFVRLFAAGPAAIPVVETLDQRDLFTRLLPEWEPVRCRPQRNAFHRFTVDRHLCETAANASAFVDRVERPDLLLVGALLHDIGKGYPGDHTDVGIVVVREIAERMGYALDDLTVLQDMVRHHLLLPDVATRRDLSDEGTVRFVADRVGSLAMLRLLGALTEADSLATGPAAWSTWKAELVAELVARVAHLLGGSRDTDAEAATFPTPEQLARVSEGRRIIEGLDDELLVIAPDRPGVFARVAAALSLNGLDVLAAAARTEQGMAVESYRVESNFGPVIRWDRVIGDIERALDGRLALDARLREREHVYASTKRTGPGPSAPSVSFDNDLSDVSTVVEVRAPDAIGVLYRITRAIADLDVDVRSAKVQTFDLDVLDSFYVQDRDGRKITDPDYLHELERSILAAL
jgi:[protein-PII] uridylyltransferase